MKLIRTERGSSKTILARFEAGRQAIALMDHPHIAKLLDVGETPPTHVSRSAQPYFAMELVKGVPLTDFCDAHKLSIPDRLALFMQICSAVQHAHQKGIIHRDLKPSNILVELHDDKPVLKVIDFGLAKMADTKQEYADRAMEFLNKAVAAGYDKADWLGKDIDLDPLREREDFKKLLAEMNEKKANSDKAKRP